jgi:hypothetical protein
MEHLSILIIPLALIFSIVYDRWRIGSSLSILLLIFLFAFPWAMYFFTPIPLTQEILFLFLPLFTVIGLYWIRWWALSPPRVWADLTNKN